MARFRMRPTGLLAVLLVLSAMSVALVVPPVSAAPAQPSPASAKSQMLIVRFKPGASAADLGAVLAENGASFDRSLGKGGLARIKLASGANGTALLAALRANGAVAEAGFDLKVQAFDIPNDPAYPRQWHMQRGAGGIDIEGAWAISPARGAGVTVAVIDTGVAYENHTNGQGLFGPKTFAPAPDLAGVPIVAPWDWIEGDSHANDEHGHGTHVSGTILQGSNNGISGTGVSAASLMPLRILDFAGDGSGSDLIDALYYATDHGAEVINLSLGFSGTGAPDANGEVCTEIVGLADALEYAYALGVTVVAASGNDGASLVACPAAYPTVIAVGATRYDGAVTFYSNRGNALSVTAPGGDPNVDQDGNGESDQVIQQGYCLDPFFLLITGGYNQFCDMPSSGTSMASPHVAGTAALLIAQHATLSPSQVRDILESTARDGGAPGFDPAFGFGVIDAAAALAELIANPPPPPPPGPPPPPRPTPQPGATNVVATTLNASSIRLNWTDSATGESGFRIDRSSDGGNSWVQAATTTANATTYTNLGLAPSTAYAFRIRSFDAFTHSPWSAPVTATTGSPPSAPTGLTATVTGSTRVRLDWTDTSTGEQGFKIERSTNGTTFALFIYASANATTVTINSLSADTNYWFRVRSYEGTVDSAPTNVATATTFPPPSAPADLVATAVGAGSIRLNWTDTSPAEQGFKVERSADGGTTWAQVGQLAANTVTWTNSGLTPATAYAFRVRAYDGIVNGAFSGIATASTFAAPAAPANLTATALNASSIRLDWLDNSTAEQGFKVERSGDGGATWAQVAQLAANIVTWTNSGLLPATNYSFRVRAYEGLVHGDFSNVATASTSGAPAAPGNLTTTPLTTTTIRLNWADSSSGEQGFKVERSLAGGSWTQIGVAAANATTYNAATLLPGTSYSFRVRAYEGVVNGDYSNIATASTLPPPSAPAGLTVVGTSTTSVQVSWTNTSPYQTALKVERSTDGVNWTQVAMLSATTVTYPFNSLLPATEYHFRVRAAEGNTNGPYSDSAVGSTFGPPAAPANLQITVLGPSWARLNWTDLSTYESGYRVERSTDGVNWTQVAQLAPNSTNWTVFGLSSGATYYFRLRAYAGTTNGPYSEVAQLTMP